MFRTGISQTVSLMLVLSSTSVPGIVSNCPSRWRDLPNDIQVSWAAPQRPNGVVLRYYIILTSYDSRTVVASASTNENATLSVELSNANLGTCCRYTQGRSCTHKCIHRTRPNSAEQ